MALFLVTAPTVEPVTLTEAKLHCKVDLSTDDTLFSNWIRAAREYAESFTNRALCTQTWDYKLDAFPSGWTSQIDLPLPPVQSVTSVKYLDMNGTEQTWATTSYITDLPAGQTCQKGRLTPGYQFIYPVTYPVISAVRIRTVNGYASPGDVPGMIKSALLLLIEQMNDKRIASIEIIRGLAAGEVSTADKLLWPFKVW